MRFSKIFGIGLPRTGTTSLNTALNSLGISSIHFPFSLYQSNDLAILNKYTAFTDAPIPLLYQYLDQTYPNSGFILTKRPLEDWLNSMAWLLSEGPALWGWKAEYDHYHEEFFGSAQFEQEIYRAKYESFHVEVSNYFRGRNNLLLLDLNVGYGYSELCQFLDLPISLDPYPRSNESRGVKKLQAFAYQVGKWHKGLEKNIRKVDYYMNRIQSIYRKFNT